MQKRIAVYSAKTEKGQIAFGAAIMGIDSNAVEIIDNHAMIFHSDKTWEEIWEILTQSGIELPPDEFWVFSIDKFFTGYGIAVDELKTFLLQ